MMKCGRDVAAAEKSLVVNRRVVRRGSGRSTLRRQRPRDRVRRFLAPLRTSTTFPRSAASAAAFEVVFAFEAEAAAAADFGTPGAELGDEDVVVADADLSAGDGAGCLVPHLGDGSPSSGPASHQHLNRLLGDFRRWAGRLCCFAAEVDAIDVPAHGGEVIDPE